MQTWGRLQSRLSFVAIAATVITATLYLFYFDGSGPSLPNVTHQSTSSGASKLQDENESTEWILSHNFKFPIHFSSQEIVVRPRPGLERASITKVNTRSSRGFFSDQHVVNTKYTLGSWRKRLEKTLTLDVPAPRRTYDSSSAKNIMFGIQTTMKRLEDSLPHFSRWLAHSGARLFVILIEKEGVPVDPERLKDVEGQLLSKGCAVTLVPAKEKMSFPQRYFSLVHLLYENRAPETEWISLLDDDTFFPSMPLLLEMLEKHDPKEEHYLGALSEDWWAIATYGYMAFGGGGMFLSTPLAAKIDPFSEACMQNLRSNAGDMATMDCIYTHSNTKLTPIQELNQVDLQGDVSGFYESGRNQISLHHWKDGSLFGNGLPMPEMHLVADVCGECFLQRWQFGDEWMLTNGYSVTHYPNGHLRDAVMDRPEHTWNQNMDIRHSLAPTRPRLELEKDKIQYLFLNATTSNRGVRQLYFHKGVDNDHDSVLELYWRMADDT